MTTAMVLLVGEQPIPNLLPVRVCTPDQVLLLHTDRTQAVAARLTQLLSNASLHLVDAFDIAAIELRIRELLTTAISDHATLLFNLTGGTKPMMLGAYRVAEKLAAPFLYYQTEGRQSLIYHHAFVDGRPVLQHSDALPGLISIADYLRVHTGSFQITGFANTQGGLFERAIYAALDGALDEVIAGVRLSGQLEVDLVIRQGNRVGLIEAKSGQKAARKEGIDQLNTGAGRAYLGTYTSKFLIVDRHVPEQSGLPRLARERDITLIELPSYAVNGVIDPTEAQTMVAAIRANL